MFNSWFTVHVFPARVLFDRFYWYVTCGHYPADVAVSGGATDTEEEARAMAQEYIREVCESC